MRPLQRLRNNLSMINLKRFLAASSRYILTYFCIGLICIQNAINTIALFCPSLYTENVEFYCTQFFGCPLVLCLLMCVVCYEFKLSSWAWACALAECVFFISFMVIKQDNIYNLSIQLITGIASVIVSLYQKWKK